MDKLIFLGSDRNYNTGNYGIHSDDSNISQPCGEMNGTGCIIGYIDGTIEEPNQSKGEVEIEYIVDIILVS